MIRRDRVVWTLRPALFWATFAVSAGFLALGVGLASLLPIVVAGFLAGGTLLAIGLLRARYLLRAWAGRRRDVCPAGHVGRAVSLCPNCGAPEADLRPSIHGVLRARCECGDWLPTAPAKLPRRCRECQRDLEHPRLGHWPEYVVILWGTAGKTAWLRRALAELADGADADVFVNAAQRDAASEAADTSLAWTVAPLEPGTGRRVLHLFDPPGSAPLPLLAGTDGIVLVLDVGLAAPDSAVEALFECWDRRRTGQVSRRHRLPVVVVARGLPAGTADVAAALRERGFANALRALEGRFHPVGYFAWSPGDSAPPALRWLMRRM